MNNKLIEISFNNQSVQAIMQNGVVFEGIFIMKTPSDDDFKTNIDSYLPDVLHSLLVLNTPSRSGSRTRQTSGFFSSIDYGRVASSTYNTLRGKTAGRLLAVFKYLTTPLNKGFNNLEGHNHE